MCRVFCVYPVCVTQTYPENHSMLETTFSRHFFCAVLIKCFFAFYMMSLSPYVDWVYSEMSSAVYVSFKVEMFCSFRYMSANLIRPSCNCLDKIKYYYFTLFYCTKEPKMKNIKCVIFGTVQNAWRKASLCGCTRCI